MGSVIITGSILVDVELTELWEQSLSEYVDSNFTLCDVEIENIEEV